MEKKIAILGLGYSLKDFNPTDFDFSIGVNDIWSKIHSDAVVCLNYPKDFTPERYKIINECTPGAFYSQMVIWDTHPNFVKIDLLPGYPDNFCQLETKELHKSYCSPFVACEIAYKIYKATEIHLFGVDMTNHPHLDQYICGKIKTHFINLKAALTQKGCNLIVHGQGILKDI
jgi:hypothetical protein